MNLTLSQNNINHQVNPINMRGIFNHKPLQHNAHHSMINMNMSRKANYNTNTNNHDRVLKFDMTFEKYLTEIETITDRRLHPSQRVKLKEAIENHDYKRLSSEQSRQHRSDFNSNRKYIISDWEEMTGNKWPTYDKPVYSNSGKMIRRVGDKFDAHHILENSWGGNNVAWNMIPARHPDQHQQQIHRPNGLADRIFN